MSLLPSPRPLRGIDMSLTSTGPLRQWNILGFPTQRVHSHCKAEKFLGLWNCATYVIFQTFLGRGVHTCINSGAVVLLKMISCEAGPFSIRVSKERKKNLTSKLDVSLGSPGNHKITPLRTAEGAISLPLASLKDTRAEEEGLQKGAEHEIRAEWTWAWRMTRQCWSLLPFLSQREFHQQLHGAGAAHKDENPSRQEPTQTAPVSTGSPSMGMPLVTWASQHERRAGITRLATATARLGHHNQTAVEGCWYFKQVLCTDKQGVEIVSGISFVHH